MNKRKNNKYLKLINGNIIHLKIRIQIEMFEINKKKKKKPNI